MLHVPQITPAKLARSKQPFSNPEWLFELKWDGVRCFIFRDRRGVIRLVSRNEKPLDERFATQDSD